MSATLRLFVVTPSQGYATAVEQGDIALDLLQMQNRTSLEANWHTLPLRWEREHKDDITPTITKAVASLSAICFPSALLSSVFPTRTPDLEFLPASIDAEPWLLLNCLRVTDAFDRGSSDLQLASAEGHPPWIVHVRWINVVDEAALEWDVFGIPNAAGPSSSRRLFVTDLFVERCSQLDLRGLDFEHVGYIVADASQVVPKPPPEPAPPPRSARPSRRKPPKLTASPLSSDQLAELAEAGEQWRQRLQITAQTGAQTVLQRLTDESQRLRPTFWSMTADERIDTTLGLAAIYGDLLREAYGWSWAEVRRSRNHRFVAVASPPQAHAVAVMSYVQQQMQTDAPTFTLLFNMIGAGSLPASAPGQLGMIG